MRRRKDFKRILYLAFLFLYLYIPVIAGVFTAYLTGICGLVYLFVFSRRIPYKTAGNCVILILAGIYVIFIGWVGTRKIVNTSASILYLACFSIPASLLLADMGKKLGYGIREIIENLAYAGFLQGIIAVMFFLFDAVRIPFLIWMGYDVAAESLADILSVRLFGIAAGLTYAMPGLQAVIGTITAVYAIRVKGKGHFLWFVPVIWFSGIINARTAIVIIFAGILFIFSVSGAADAGRMIRLGLTGALSLAAAAVVVIRMNPGTGAWILDGIYEIVGFFLGREDGYYFTALRSENFRSLPQGMALILGTGTYPPSDIGFVRNIWAGGIVLCVMVYGVYLHMFAEVKAYIKKQADRKLAKKTYLFCLAAMILLNIKGEICGMNEVGSLLMLICAAHEQKL